MKITCRYAELVRTIFSHSFGPIGPPYSPWLKVFKLSQLLDKAFYDFGPAKDPGQRCGFRLCSLRGLHVYWILWTSHGPHTGRFRAPHDCMGLSKPLRHPHRPVCAPYGTRRVLASMWPKHQDAHRPSVCI